MTTSAPESAESIKYRNYSWIGGGAVIGSLIGLVIGLVITSGWTCSPNESGLCAAFYFAIVLPLSLVTLGFLWWPFIKLSYFAMPWYLVFSKFITTDQAAIFGLICNGTMIGVIVAYISRYQPKAMEKKTTREID